MKNWEDIIKDKLEGYESPLPEGSLAEFRSRREGAASAAAKKRSPLIWILPTAAAAILAAALFLRKPNGPDDLINTIQQPTTTVAAAATDSIEKAEPVQALQPAQPSQLIAQAATPNTVLPASGNTKKTDAVEDVKPENNTMPAEDTGHQEAEGQAENEQEVDGQAENEQKAEGQAATGQEDNQGIRTATTFDFPTVEPQTVGKDASYNYAVLATAGSALGAGLLATLATNLNFGWLASNSEPDGAYDMRYAHAAYLKFLYYLELLGIDPEYEEALFDLISSNSAVSSNSALSSDDDITEFCQGIGVDTSSPEFDDFIKNYTNVSWGKPATPEKDETPVDNRLKTIHLMPLKAGLSVRTPVSEKLYLTTGLDYSRYVSIYKYSLSGDHKQIANYLGIPLRLDWTFVAGKRLELYLGGGVEAEWCLGAKLDGHSIGKDKFNMSLLGAGGIQLNITKNVGVYVEPEVSWKMSLNEPVLATYRSEHPVMFAVATGIRVTID